MKFTTILIITLISITSCGYTVVSQKNFNKYKIENLIISGDKRIAYLLRNKLKSNNKNTSKIINLDLSSNKVKNIKEKNIQNNVNKYEIIITIIVNFEILDSNKSGQFTIQKKGNYNVGGRHGITLSNEKKLINNLTEKISEQIFETLALSINDL